MKIRHAVEADQPAWDVYVQEHSEGVAYQLFAWQQAVADAYGFSGRYLLAENEGGICGVLPLIEFRLPLQPVCLLSLPYCDAGGILADSADIAEQLLSHLASIFQRENCGGEIRSVSQLPSVSPNRTDKVRMVLELPQSSEELLAGLKAKLRSQVKKPMRDGLTAKLGGSELVDIFYDIFAQNMRDLGSPVHSKRWIKSVVESYGGNARVAVVFTPEEQPAAAGIILLHQKTVSIPWASALRDYNRMNPNMLLYWTFLAFAADSGYRYFDFGRSTPGEGTYRFKQQWGARPQPLYWYQFPDKILASAQEVVAEKQNGKKTSPRELVASLWQRLPLTIANALGPQLRKYISL